MNLIEILNRRSDAYIGFNGKLSFLSSKGIVRKVQHFLLSSLGCFNKEKVEVKITEIYEKTIQSFDADSLEKFNKEIKSTTNQNPCNNDLIKKTQPISIQFLKKLDEENNRTRKNNFVYIRRKLKEQNLDEKYVWNSFDVAILCTSTKEGDRAPLDEYITKCVLSQWLEDFATL